MIFKRSLHRELLFYTLGIYATLFLATLTFTTIRLLGQASSGRIDPQSVFLLMGYALVNYQGFLLSMSVFLGTLLTFTRMWRDSEMVVWSASGLGLTRFVAPTLRFALPIALLAGLFTTVVAPWANRQAAYYKDAFEKRDDLARVAIGQFRESANGTRVFFVESGNEDNSLVNQVFLYSNHPKTNAAGTNAAGVATQSESVVVAQTAQIINEADGDRFLIMNKGRRYEQDTLADAKKLGLRWMDFDTYKVLLAEKTPTDEAFQPYKLRSTLTLAAERSNPAIGELLWRISSPIAALLLAFLAIPLSYFNPRSGRATPIVTAILIFLIYYNALTTAQNGVQSGKWLFYKAAATPHLFVFILATLLLLWRSQWIGSQTSRIFRAMRPKRAQHKQTQGRSAS